MTPRSGTLAGQNVRMEVLFYVVGMFWHGPLPDAAEAAASIATLPSRRHRCHDISSTIAPDNAPPANSINQSNGSNPRSRFVSRM